jgi:hypothetical protein
MAAKTRGSGHADGGDAPIEHFIDRWLGQEGGQEGANYALFLTELCAMPDLSPPDLASAPTEETITPSRES